MPTATKDRAEADKVLTAFSAVDAQERRKQLAKSQREAIAGAARYKSEIEALIKEHPEYFTVPSGQQAQSREYRLNSRFMSRAAARYLLRQQAKVDRQYYAQPSRIPLDFPDSESAEHHLLAMKKDFLNAEVAEGIRKTPRKHLTLTEAVEVFIKSRLGATCVVFEGLSTPTLYLYDYDNKIYTYSEVLVARWLTALVGVAKQADLRSFVLTLQGQGDRLAVNNPAPRWKIAVGNGLYNTITRKLEPYTPREVVTNRIETNLVVGASEPDFASGITFEKLVSDLANNKEERAELIMQMCKVIFTGYSSVPAIFVAVGSGGDGKSVFLSLISNIIGGQNTGPLNFTDMGEESKIVEVAQKKLVVGMDNDPNVTIKSTAFLKSAASREVTSFKRKFLPAVAMRFAGTIVQLCNSLPRFGESGSAIRRRILTILCENSHYERGNEDTNLAENIKNQRWHEYILWYVLNEHTCPYFDDFNDVDRNVLNASLDVEDPIGSFYDDLAQDGFFDKRVEVLPRNVLYAAYQDWFANTYPGSQPVAARTFSTRSDAILRNYGYASGSDVAPVRLSALRNDYNLSFEEILGHRASGHYVQKVLSSSSTTRVVTLNPAFKAPTTFTRKGRKLPKKVEAITYFAMWDEIISDIEYAPAGYIDIAEDCNISLNILEVVPAEQTLTSPYDMGEEDTFELEARLEASYRAVIGQSDSEPERIGSYGASIIANAKAKFAAAQSTDSVVVFETHSLDVASATLAEIEQASHSELLDSIDQLADRLAEERVAKRLVKIVPDVASMVRSSDDVGLTASVRWLGLMDKAVESDPRLKLDQSAALANLISQLRFYASSDSMGGLLQELEGLEEETTEVRSAELKKIISSFISAKN